MMMLGKCKLSLIMLAVVALLPYWLLLAPACSCVGARANTLLVLLLSLLLLTAVMMLVDTQEDFTRMCNVAMGQY